MTYLYIYNYYICVYTYIDMCYMYSQKSLPSLLPFRPGFSPRFREDLPPEPLTDADFEPCRYKLLIDATEDGGALRVLQSLQMIPEGCHGTRGGGSLVSRGDPRV